MRLFNVQPGDHTVLNLAGGDAIVGDVRLVSKHGTIFLAKATLHTPQGTPQPLDGGVQIPASSILWVQVV